jgi:hypothetical protein
MTSWFGTPRLTLVRAALAGIGDCDGDGLGDLLIGAPIANINDDRGAWQLVSGAILASVRSHPVACDGGPFPSELGATRPVLGGVMTLVGRDCPPNALGVVAMSGVPDLPLNLGATGCDLWFRSGWVSLHSPPPGSQWSLPVPIPAIAQLAGLHLALQAMYFPTGGPLGFDLSNGLWLRVGY